MTERISIVIPSYNSEASIERCVRSAAAQSYTEVEILAVDDASTDGTLAILEKLEKEIPNLRVIAREKNGGVSAARNTGIEAAAGKWLVTLDGDDYIEDEMLASLYGAAHQASGKYGEASTEPAAEMAVCGIRLVYPDRTEVIKAPAEEKLPAAEFLNKYMCTLWDTHLLTTHSNKLYDLELIKKEGLRYREDLRINEDIDFVFRYLAHCRNIGMTKGAYMNYVQHDTGKSNITTFRENGLSSSLSVLEDFRRLSESGKGRDGNDSGSAAQKMCGGLSEDCVTGMERRIMVHILSFAGLMYARSGYSDKKMLSELTNACASKEFRRLVSSVKPQGIKEKLAVSLLKNGKIKAYHRLCRLFYR